MEFFEEYEMLVYFIHRFRIELSGATATEYALIAGGIALAIVTAVGLMGDSLDGIFTDVGTGL